MIVKYMKMRKICLFEWLGQIKGQIVFSDFLAKIVLFVGVNIRAKLGQIMADYGAGEGQGQSPLYIYIYKRAYLPLFGDLPLHIPRR